MQLRHQTCIFDVETDGLLPELTRIHVLHIHEYETGKSWTFRRNKKENTIHKGLKILSQAKTICGHNIIHFDLKAIEKVYPDFTYWGNVRDTLPMSRMIFADVKEKKDFRLWERIKKQVVSLKMQAAAYEKRGEEPPEELVVNPLFEINGQFIGAHSLDSWGVRLGLFKGDYAKKMEKAGLNPWAKWNQEMEDYCINDVNINVMLWLELQKRQQQQQWPESTIIFEHTIHDLVGIQEENGFPFDMEEARVLHTEMEEEAAELEAEAIERYGIWYAPKKRYRLEAPFRDPKGAWRRFKKQRPREQFGEDAERKMWAEVQIPKATKIARTLWVKDKREPERFESLPKAARPVKPGFKLNFSYEEGAPFSPVEVKEFNPSSRPQVIDRFVTIEGWEPNYEEDEDWTDAGSPKVSDGILRALSEKIPMAETIAEVFYFRKRIGQLATGKNAWIKQAVWNEEAKMYFIHHYVNTGGTVSGRASHVGPNLAQVPKVKSSKEKVFNPATGLEEEIEGPIKGRKGRHGFECRSLFTVPKGWTIVGADQAGIELRCLGAFMAPYDDGAFLEEVLNGDPHSKNQEVAGLPDRNSAKTFIYALIYGAGDIKLGSIVCPTGSLAQQKAAGKRLRSRFMKGMDGYAEALRRLQREWKKNGYVVGMDGRRLFPRAEHSLLNIRLQSDAAILAKAWYILFVTSMEEMGFWHGWDGDFVVLAWVHDEIQVAVRDEHVDFVKHHICKCAKDAPKHFGFTFHSPVDASADAGKTWAETH